MYVHKFTYLYPSFSFLQMTNDKLFPIRTRSFSILLYHPDDVYMLIIGKQKP